MVQETVAKISKINGLSKDDLAKESMLVRS
jgi:hypothetical protein